MADSRFILSYQDILAERVTYRIDPDAAADFKIVYDATRAGGSADAGRAVTISADGGKIKLAADGEFVLGKLLLVEYDGACTVQIGGYCEFARGNAKTATRGKKFVGALDAGGRGGCIRDVDDAQPANEADTTAHLADIAKGRGFIHDAADAAHVWVCLR